MNDWITVTSGDNKQFRAYVSRPSVKPAGAVIVIQEIFGVNKWLREIADWLASAGYLAVVPDLFFRLEPGVELTDQTQAEWDKAFALYKAFDENKGAEDLSSTVDAVRAMPECNGLVGTLGFCLGGKLAFLMSTRSTANCNVSFYGVGIENNIQEPVKHPLMLHVAEKDDHVPPDAQKSMAAIAEKNPLITLHSYAGAGHAFGRPGSQHYNAVLAEQAQTRSLEFLKQHLASPVSISG